MALLSTSIIAKSSDYLIARFGRGSYQLLICSHVPVNDDCCLKINENIAIENVYMAHKNSSAKNLRFIFTNVPDGKYRIISYHINQEHGSLLDEWGKMEFTPNLGSREIYYLQHAVHPNRIHTTTTASSGQLIFNIHLMPLEVIFAEIQWVPEEGGKAAPF